MKYENRKQIPALRLHICTYVCMYTHTYTHAHTFIYAHTHTYIYIIHTYRCTQNYQLFACLPSMCMYVLCICMYTYALCTCIIQMHTNLPALCLPSIAIASLMSDALTYVYNARGLFIRQSWASHHLLHITSSLTYHIISYISHHLLHIRQSGADPPPCVAPFLLKAFHTRMHHLVLSIMYVCVYVCMHACMYVCLCLSLFVCVCPSHSLSR